MSDTFPLLQKEGKLFYAVSHSSPKLKLTAMPFRGKAAMLHYIDLAKEAARGQFSQEMIILRKGIMIWRVMS